MFAGASGLLTTALGIVLAFFPAKQISSVWWYEAKMFGLTLLFLALAAFFFFVYGRNKVTLQRGGGECGDGSGERGAAIALAAELPARLTAEGGRFYVFGCRR